MPPESPAERLAREHAARRKASGLPDPSHYKQMAAQKQKEIDAMKNEETATDRLKKYIRPVTKTTPKIEKTTEPAGRTTDHTEWKVTGPSGEVKRFKSKQEAHAHYNSFSEEIEELDEISTQVKTSYRQKAIADIRALRPHAEKGEYKDLAKNVMQKRQAGVNRSVKEELEQIDEMPESSMKVRDVHAHLKKSGWALARSSGGHDIYKHPQAKHHIPVPRHKQLKAPLIRGIMKASKVTEEAEIEEQLEKKGRFVSGPVKQPFKSNTLVTSIKEEHLVHVSDGSKYNEKPHPKDVEHVNAGAKMHSGQYHDASDKGVYFKFNSHNDAKNFKYHVDKAPHKSVHADLHESADGTINVIKKGTNVKQKISAGSYDVFKKHGFRKESKDETEYGYEGDMALNQLATLTRCAEMIKELLKPDTDMPEWVQSKITLATDYIQTAADYMHSEMKEEVELDEAIKVGSKVTIHAPGKDYHGETGHVGEIRNGAFKGAPKTYTVDHSGGSTQLSQKNVKLHKEEIELDEIAVVKTNKEIGTRVVDVGPGGKEYNVKTNRAWDTAHKKQPQGAEFAAQRRKERLAKNGRMDEDAEQIDEARPSQRHPLEGHEYHKKSNDALVHIAKDAHAAAEAMKGHNTAAENKYRDQANDSATVRYYRQKHGMQDWYKKKYGHVSEGADPWKDKHFGKGVATNRPMTPEEKANHEKSLEKDRRINALMQAHSDAYDKNQKTQRNQNVSSMTREDADPCWKGYEMVGMKKKNGKSVPNCVPVKEANEPTTQVASQDPLLDRSKPMSRKAEIVRSAAKGSKGTKDKFFDNPELSGTIDKN